MRDKIKNFIFSKSGIVAILLSVYAAAMIVVAVFNLFGFFHEVDKLVFIDVDYSILHSKVSAVEGYHNILNGTAVSSEQEAMVIPLAIIIDNNLNERLPYGLDQAEIVMEVPVEGIATRFLAIFDAKNDVTKIGPVRSARPYFIDFASEYNAVLAHAGGSPEALLELDNNFAVINVDEIGADGRYFWRDQNAYPPHNLFTNTNLLTKASKFKKVLASYTVIYDDVAWMWRDMSGDIDQPIARHPLIKIDYSTTFYEVEYKYDSDVKKYARYQGGSIYKTAAGDQLMIDNILIAYMKITDIDDVGRLEIENIGQGDAVVCQLGQCQEGIWKKPSTKDRIRFYVDKKEIELIPGKTWINVVPVGRKVYY